jgi:hypothetical protein
VARNHGVENGDVFMKASSCVDTFCSPQRLGCTPSNSKSLDRGGASEAVREPGARRRSVRSVRIEAALERTLVDPRTQVVDRGAPYGGLAAVDGVRRDGRQRGRRQDGREAPIAAQLCRSRSRLGADVPIGARARSLDLRADRVGSPSVYG